MRHWEGGMWAMYMYITFVLILVLRRKIRDIEMVTNSHMSHAHGQIQQPWLH